MRMNTWFCIMHVMSRLGVFKPYSIFIEKFLRVLGDASERQIEQSKEWILEQRDYPPLGRFRNWFGHGWELILYELMREGTIIIDDDLEIIYTGITSERQRRLGETAIPLRDSAPTRKVKE